MLNRFGKVGYRTSTVRSQAYFLAGRGNNRLELGFLSSKCQLFDGHFLCCDHHSRVSNTVSLIRSTLICTLHRYFFPLFLIPALVMGLIYRHLAIGYLNAGRDLRRMESNSRSPIFSGFGEMLEGLVTVRAFSAERRFLNDLHGKVDFTTKVCAITGSLNVTCLMLS